jgi:hypothetical protein
MARANFARMRPAHIYGSCVKLQLGPLQSESVSAINNVYFGIEFQRGAVSILRHAHIIRLVRKRRGGAGDSSVILWPRRNAHNSAV